MKYLSGYSIEQILQPSETLMGELEEMRISDLETLASIYWLEKFKLNISHGERQKYENLQLVVNRVIRRRIDLTCSVCGKGASWNTPYIVEGDKEREVWCETCAKKDRGLRKFIGIDQRKDEFGHVQGGMRSLHFMQNGCMIAYYMNHYGIKGETTVYLPNWSISAWTNEGRESFKLLDEDLMVARVDPWAILTKMQILEHSGNFRCSSCGREYPRSEIAGYPLFTGVDCPKCWKKHLEFLEEQRRKGHVCGMCGQPYGNCSC